MDKTVTIEYSDSDKSYTIISNLPSLEEDKKFFEELLKNWDNIDFCRGSSLFPS